MHKVQHDFHDMLQYYLQVFIIIKARYERERNTLILQRTIRFSGKRSILKFYD